MVGRTSSGDHIFEVEMKAMRALAERFRELTQRDLVFYLIGPCDPSRYPELFRHCRIRATGRLTPEEMPLHLGACDFFLLMEENVPKCQYRGPIRVNDYMAAGRPVLCNSVGDHVQTLLNARACVVCDDLRVENEAVDRLLTVPEERIHLGRRARELAEGDLSWERLGAKLDQFLRSALA
jgi:glycosyltransferase involved in cell wall biosynthesis